MARVIKILSIDGGGIRGIIPATILAEIERRTKRPTACLFDLIAGTSTGGILALGLVKPDAEGKPAFSARDMLDLFQTKAKDIFARSIITRIKGLGGLIDDKYDAWEIENVLWEYFGGTRLKEVLTNVLITAYEIEKRSPFFFKSPKSVNNPEYDYPLAEVARATSAAPTYFEPFRLVNDYSQESYALVDGGVFANNPAMCALAEAKLMYHNAEEFILVSLGTGEVNNPYSYVKARKWGLAGWAKPVLDIVFDGVSDTVDYELKCFLPPDDHGIKRYYRFQTQLNEKDDSMDNVSKDNIRQLKSLGEALITENYRELDNLCRQLTAD